MPGSASDSYDPEFGAGEGPFQIGDRVVCRLPGSWVDGKTGVVGALDVEASDGITGHRIDFPSGYSVVPPEELEHAEPL